MPDPTGTVSIRPNARVSWPLAALTVPMMIFLPPVSFSLIPALALNRLVFRDLGRFRGASAPHAAE